MSVALIYVRSIYRYPFHHIPSNRPPLVPSRYRRGPPASTNTDYSEQNGQAKEHATSTTERHRSWKNDNGTVTDQDGEDGDTTKAGLDYEKPEYGDYRDFYDQKEEDVKGEKEEEVEEEEEDGGSTPIVNNFGGEVKVNEGGGDDGEDDGEDDGGDDGDGDSPTVINNFGGTMTVNL